MTPEPAPLVLAFDTSAAWCAAALLSGDRIVKSVVEEMSRGQAERLMPLLEEMLVEAGVTWQDLTALGVGVGPGNFTGIRIAVSAARGLALGLGVPAVGVTGCEARSFLTPADTFPAIPAPRDMVYLCNPDDPSSPPQLHAHSNVGRHLQTEYNPQGLAEAIAHIAADRWQDTTEPPAPLYIRPSDAAPSRDRPPVMLD